MVVRYVYRQNTVPVRIFTINSPSDSTSSPHHRVFRSCFNSSGCFGIRGKHHLSERRIFFGPRVRRDAFIVQKPKKRIVVARTVGSLIVVPAARLGAFALPTCCIGRKIMASNLSSVAANEDEPGVAQDPVVPVMEARPGDGLLDGFFRGLFPLNVTSPVSTDNASTTAVVQETPTAPAEEDHAPPPARTMAMSVEGHGVSAVDSSSSPSQTTHDQESASSHDQTPATAQKKISVAVDTQYAKVTDCDDSFSALVSLLAASTESEENRTPVELTLVIDKSGSMAGAPMKLVKRAYVGRGTIREIREGEFQFGKVVLLTALIEDGC